MAIEGPLRELALTDVFQLLDLSRKTGTLTITPEGRERPAVVRFDRGAVTGAELGEAHERIGHLLLRAGKVTEAQVAEARRAQRARPGTPLGTLLVESGAVAEGDVERQLRFQIQEVVFDLIQWKDGYFRFEEGAGAVPGGVAVRVTTESLLMEAARRVDEWSTLETKVPHMGVVPALVGDSADGPALDLHPTEWEVLAEIDGTRTLKTIAGALGRSDFDVAKIVFGLVSTGVVDVREAEPEDARAAAPDRPLQHALDEARAALAEGAADRARRVLDELARAHPDRAEVYLLLAEAQLRLARWGEAVLALGRAASLDPLAAAYREQGRHDAALRLAVRGLERHPGNVEAHHLLGLLYRDAGDELKAFDEWDIALALDADHAPARREIGLSAHRRGEWALAVRHLERALQHDAFDAEVRAALEDAWTRSGGVRAPAAAPAPTAPARAAAQGPVPAEPESEPDPLAALGRERGIVGAVLLDDQGFVLAGRMEVGGTDRAAEVAAVLAGASAEAARALAHLGLGAWRGILVETPDAVVRLAPAGDGMVAVAGRREVPTGWVLRVAGRAQGAALGVLGEDG
jgi:tetratricopeptide (TPR) repeat protein